MPKPSDPWPKYWTPDSAFFLARRAAEEWNLADKPLADWTLEERLKVALASLKWENT